MRFGGRHLSGEISTGHIDRWRLFLAAVHPDCAAEHVHGIGGNAGIWIAPSTEDGPANVVLLAPTRAECRTAGWLADAMEAAAARLSPDGILYVLSPRGWRGRAATLLRRAGFEPASPVGHFISAAAQCHVQLRSGQLLYALDNFPVPMARLYRPLLKPLLGAGIGPKLLAAWLPLVGIPASRRGAAAPFRWFRDRDGGAAAGVSVVSTSDHGMTTIALRFAEGASLPSLIAKIRKHGMGDGGIDEDVRLSHLGPAAHEAGIVVPTVLRRLTCDGSVSLIETVVPGRTVARLLRRRPERFLGIVEELADRLVLWHRLTIAEAHLTPERRESDILLPARRLLDELSRGQPYLHWLTQRSLGVMDRPVPWVATHNDLTMVNLLCDDAGRLGIVDWDGAEPEGLPLSDFWYAACDALAAATGYADRAAAFADCFSESGRYRPALASCERRLRHLFDEADDWIQLCFHACWLQHAMNERQRSPPGAPRPFLAIARMLSLGFDQGV